MLNLLRAFLHLGVIIPPLPYNILDGQLIDAVPVMGNFNAIVAAVNANVPALVGNNTFVPTGSVGGTGNAITLAPNPIITAYAQGQTFTFQAIASNTGNTTIQTSGLAPRTVRTSFGTTLTGNEITINGIYTVTDNGTFYVLMNSSQGSGLITFTPTIAFGGASVGITYSVQSGVGFKLNNMFFFCASVTMSNKGSSTGDLALSNFPYTVNSAWVDGVYPAFVDNITIAGSYLLGFPNPGTVFQNVVMVNSAGVVTTITDADCTNTTAVAMQGFYPV